MLVVFRESALLAEQHADARIVVVVGLVDPDELVPDLQVADVLNGELSGLRACARSARFAAPLQQLAIARIRIDHARPLRVEEVLDTEPALVVSQICRRLQPQLEVSVAGLFSRERFDLDEQ